jgi:steroid delta-isomerase-like uncharacterized protein
VGIDRIVIAFAALALSACATIPAENARTASTEATRVVVERYWAAVEAGDANAAAALFAENAVYRDKTFDFEISGIPAIRKMLEGAISMLSPVSRKIVTAAYDGRYAAIEWEAQGVHVMPVMGIPATNKEMTIRAVSLIEVRGGRIQSVTDYTDRAGLESQLKG